MKFEIFEKKKRKHLKSEVNLAIISESSSTKFESIYMAKKKLTLPRTKTLIY